ncbi:GNAT family N-acetyltransferase [Nocardia speluncae]|uniref:GNAT family N-acetyltransferase n=1 Tax=Nocardia speluncae TaxID=419477 RepID=A0A846XFS4_9NOCA|nr:GNAT family N-acetyltransferase [Nocardia speluncae]NKY33463.1 GNAT family N-acetyltransferase [Nocardia speluncae]
MRRIRHVTQDDPLAAPLLTELAIEYSLRYGRTAGEIRHELATYPAAEFAPPDGGLLIVIEDSEPVAGGAFRRYDTNTAELKRIWTAREHRRRGLGRLVLAELEAEIIRRGYSRIYLTTGPRQPEAVALYNAAGYTALGRVLEHEVGRLHPFEKYVPAGANPRPGSTAA